MKMTVRHIRRCLWLITIAALAMVAWVVCYGFTNILSPPPPEVASTMAPDVQQADPIPATESAPLGSQRLSAKDFRGVWSFNLRRPLYDPPPLPAATPKAFKPPPMKLQLLGTIIEPDHSQAIVTAADGQVVFPGVGDRVDEAVIQTITTDSITVFYYDQTVTLTVPKE